MTYQIGNSLTTQEHRARTSDYYSDGGKPRFYCDGSKSSTNYPSYDQHKSTYESRQAVPSPATVVMESSCPQSQGTVEITVTNTSNSDISATLQVALTEYLTVTGLNGQPRKTWTVRDMLPDAKGELITLSAGQSVTKNRDFTVQSGWKKDGCKLVAFIQAGDKEILQGCTVGLNQGVSIHSHNRRSNETMQIKSMRGSCMIRVPFTEKYAVTVVDIRGRVVQRSTVDNSGQWYTLDKSLPAGMHIVRITTPDREVVRKIWIINN